MAYLNVFYVLVAQQVALVIGGIQTSILDLPHYCTHTVGLLIREKISKQPRHDD